MPPAKSSQVKSSQVKSSSSSSSSQAIPGLAGTGYARAYRIPRQHRAGRTRGTSGKYTWKYIRSTNRQPPNRASAGRAGAHGAGRLGPRAPGGRGRARGDQINLCPVSPCARHVCTTPIQLQLTTTHVKGTSTPRSKSSRVFGSASTSYARLTIRKVRWARSSRLRSGCHSLASLWYASLISLSVASDSR